MTLDFEPADPHRASLVLDASADVLDRDGWNQGSYVEEHGTRCLVGAVKKVEHDFEIRRECYDFLHAVIGEPRTYLTDWNDRDGRTKDEVTAALRKAAKLAKQAYDRQK